MLEEFRKYIEDNRLMDPQDRVLLAVSGGIDSMVMAHLFISIKANIGIAHCNFCLRGKESLKDEAFVKSFASDHNVPFFCERFDTTGFASEKGISVQMAARELRYKWFEEIREKYNYRYISVAHNLNDNAETFLINLTRGTGIAGLTGMKPRHRNLIRPMLFTTRKAIVEYRDFNKITFREDRSNSETKYTRNKIRHNIIPQFKEINPSFETSITETAERLNEINEIITGHISEIREKALIERENTIVFKISILQSLSPKLTTLFELFRPYGIGKGQLNDLISLIDGKTGSRLITSGFRFLKNRKELLISKNEINLEDSFKIEAVADFFKIGGCISAAVRKVDASFTIPESRNIACLDSDKIIFPLKIRKWEYGDSFYPLGMNQKKKLSDYFVDRKYSVLAKENCRILESENRIVWIINERIDNRFRIGPSTKKALIIEFEESGDVGQFT